MNADAITSADNGTADNGTAEEDASRDEEIDTVNEDGIDAELMKNNRETVDDATRQKLSMEEIEELKQIQSGSGKEIIARIMESHTALGEKTAFSLAKYTLRKSKKFLRRFTVLPLNVSNLLQWISMERESHKIMDLREETLGLIASWVNIHYFSPLASIDHDKKDDLRSGNGRWLLVEDTSGLLLACLAERLDILYREEACDKNEAQGKYVASDGREREGAAANSDPNKNNTEDLSEELDRSVAPSSPHNPQVLTKMQKKHSDTNKMKVSKSPQVPAMSARDNTITLIHPTSQPNLALLRYFGYDSNDPLMDHPLYTHLKTLSWLQLLHPEEDSLYEEPEVVSEEILQSWKSGKRSTYHKKRRRWEKVKRVTDETRAGQFDGLVVATTMEPASVLRHTVPLLRGGAQVVVYSPFIEPLAELVDYYSKARKVAYMQESLRQGMGVSMQLDEEDFPVDPTALLAPKIQTSRVRTWQVLPGRTHPMMTSKGGAEGYIFTATKILPAATPIQGRGAYGKRRKISREQT